MIQTHKLLSLIIIGMVFILPLQVFAVEQLKKIPSRSNPAYVTDELLVKFKREVKKSQKSQIALALGVREVRYFGERKVFSRIKLQKGQSVQSMLAAYRADPNVEYVQPNYIYHASAIPDDDNYTQLWGLNNITGYDIDAQLAWDNRTDCRNTIVAVLDTGVDYTHQDLADNMWDGTKLGYPNHGYDFVGENIFMPIADDDPIPMGSIEDHGTHVAGTIGAVGNNANGTTGVCWRAQIMSVRVLDSIGVGLSSTLIQGVEYAVNNGAKIINMSLGFRGDTDQLLSNAISFAKDNDVVVVVAAGNELSDNEVFSTIPCNFTHDNLVCVAALDQDYSLADFSNYGAISVDLGAPGIDITSTIPTGQTINDPLIIDRSISDPLRTWKTNNDNWTTALCYFSTGFKIIGLNTLVNPASWCTQQHTYDANADDRIYKTFDLSGGADHALLFYQPFIETQAGSDIFSSVFDNSGGDPKTGDPFDTVNNIPLLDFSGTNDTDNIYFIHDMTACLTSTCTIGFRLTSDATIEYGGIGIPIVTISTLENGGNAYERFRGTSMATPHVTGIAALVRAYNPDFTYADTVAALKGGGEAVDSLAGITTTGKAANAMGSLSYINPPTGVTAVVQ